MLLRLKIDSRALFVVQNDQRSERNRMVMARMPEDRSKTFKNLQSHIHLRVCTPVGPTDKCCID
eukprot:5296411-Heterocapsa_arctica.AAC.1